jgi:hypothetical protein
VRNTRAIAPWHGGVGLTREIARVLGHVRIRFGVDPVRDLKSYSNVGACVSIIYTDTVNLLEA